MNKFRELDRHSDEELLTIIQEMCNKSGNALAPFEARSWDRRERMRWIIEHDKEG